MYFQEQPYITEWFTAEQVAEVREKEAQVYEHVHGLIDRGIASGEFYECDSHVLALGYIGMTLGSYRWLRPSGRRSAKEIAAEFSTALLRGLIRDESIRADLAARALAVAHQWMGGIKWSTSPASPLITDSSVVLDWPSEKFRCGAVDGVHG